MTKLKYFFRVLLIYLSIIYIALGSIVIGYLIIPLWALLRLSWPTKESSRKMTQIGVKFYLWSLNKLGLIEFELKNFVQLDSASPKIFISNHRSLFDILFFITLIPNSSCIVKPSLAKYSPFNAIIFWAKYIVNKQDAGIMDAALLELRSGNSLIIFPEGSRLKAELQRNADKHPKIQSFNRGAASISVRSGIEIIPVTFNYDPPALGKNFKWNDLPHRKCKITMRFHASITPPKGKETGVLAREFTSFLEKKYQDILN